MFTIITMLLFPDRVTLLQDRPGHVAADTPANREMSVSDTAGGYQIVLLFGPGLTALAGMIGAHSPRHHPSRRPTTATSQPQTNAPR